MRITHRWLRDYVDFEWSPEELEERLTMLGLEVEGMERTGGGYEGVVVVEVLSRDPHPDADRLSVCKVTDGKEIRQIVCGATNFGVGDRVPLILPGHALPPVGDRKPQVIRKGKLRGVVSEGMMCSGRELGIGEDGEGLLVLDPSARAGTPLATCLGEDEEDWVYDLEVTPNRPDWNGIIGIAREVSALTGNPLNLPRPDPPESGTPASERIRVVIRDYGLCPRYTARWIGDVTIGPSPAPLRKLLERIGVRSINNVVDASNFVMMETGHPLHAFDIRLVAPGSDGRAEVIVRGADPGETFTGLDGQEHRLPADAVVIADPRKAIALGGIMGGRNSEIGEDTRDVLLESACFSPPSIRRTSRTLGLRTDASYRYERGSDPEIADWTSRRTAELICRNAGAVLHPGLVDEREEAFTPVRIPFRFDQTTRLLGIEIPEADQIRFLEHLGLEHDEEGTWTIPSFRRDLTREADLVEEVARLHGVDRIPATPPRGGIGTHPHDPVHDRLARVRSQLVGMGLSEIQGQTLISESAPGLLRDCRPAFLEYPLSADMNILRPSLLPGMLEVLRHNAHQGIPDAALFEIGSTFGRKEDEMVENRALALTLTGRRAPESWAGTSGDCDFFDLKGRLEVLLEALDIGGVQWRGAPQPDPLFIEECHLIIGRRIIGRMGQLQPTVGSRLDLRKPVFLAELDADRLFERPGRTPAFRSLPQYPAIRRDLALLVDEEVTHERILQVIRKVRAPHLRSARLFDVFRGEGIPDGKKSLAWAFVYRDAERTLTDSEVSRSHTRLVETLQRELRAEIR